MPTTTRSRSRSDVGRKESKRSHKISKRYSDDEESSSERRERKSSRRAKEASEGGSKFKTIPNLA